MDINSKQLFFIFFPRNPFCYSIYSQLTFTRNNTKVKQTFGWLLKGVWDLKYKIINKKNPHSFTWKKRLVTNPSDHRVVQYQNFILGLYIIFLLLNKTKNHKKIKGFHPLPEQIVFF